MSSESLLSPQIFHSDLHSSPEIQIEAASMQNRAKTGLPDCREVNVVPKKSKDRER